MEIATQRFGHIEVDGADLFVFPAGLIGLERLKRWALLSEPGLGSAAWMQSVESPEVALAVINPQFYWPQCRLHVARQELAVLGLSDLRQIEVLAIVTRHERGLTANLKAPLVFDLRNRLGCQVICNGEEPLRMPLDIAPPAVRRSA